MSKAEPFPAPERAKSATRRAAGKASVEYPESDGKPMAETPLHWQCTVDVTLALRAWYRDNPRVYVGSDMMMYPEEGNPRRSVSADVFVALDTPKQPERRVWMVWEEGKLADFVVEITSRSTRHRDQVVNARLYESLGVREYWQYDPTGDYLDPVLRGRRAGPDGRWQEIVLEDRGGLLCGASLLGLELHLLTDRSLRLFDPGQREYLPVFEEEVEGRMREREARLAAEATLKEKETEIEALKRRLRED